VDPGPARQFPVVPGRVDPHTTILHGYSDVRFERQIPATVDQIIISRTLKALSPGQKCRHNDINDYIRGFRVFIDSTFARITFTTVDARAKFIFRLYGWFESCECGSTREGFAKIANALKFVNWYSENELPLDIKFEFFPVEDKQVCQICGE
jgi:hypothetical protein